jgi:hypothetical protein
VNVEVLSSDFPTGMGLLADVVLNPTLAGPPLEREREVQIATIRSQKDDLLKSASKSHAAGTLEKPLRPRPSRTEESAIGSSRRTARLPSETRGTRELCARNLW